MIQHYVEYQTALRSIIGFKGDKVEICALLASTYLSYFYATPGDIFHGKAKMYHFFPYPDYFL
jgi:hypothetical protein